ncbi:hypothetical protein GN958_ATG18897 [Phytophthora infestans]|uniref:Uncharacterized protein n=1 Tax=Phytophthora infestans TaxID=4787 RepID=A0A8S9TYX2_PHYIN|nr:hypothetical protein GN958_ATG18897 [Phytophthora infestans]
MSNLSSLPPSVLAHVLELAVCGISQNLAPAGRSLHLDGVKNVALVCKSTLRSVRSLVSVFRATTMSLALENEATIVDVETMYRRVEMHGVDVTDLRIRLGEYTIEGHPFMV